MIPNEFVNNFKTNMSLSAQPDFSLAKLSCLIDTYFLFLRLTQTSLTQYNPSHVSGETSLVNIENWTKWRLFVESDEQSERNDKTQIIYGSSAKPIHLKNKVIHSTQ